MPRRDRLGRIFQNASDVDVVAIFNGDHVDPNFFYISGYRSGIFERNALFLFPDRHVEVLTNTLEEDAARQRKDYTIHVEKGSDPSEHRRMVSSILKGSKRVGINFQGVSHKDYLALKTMLGSKRLIDVSDALARSRLVKDPD
ncbi:MAG: aminopeptidase P family N-terminal domain-containing protein, partial [Nitrososphaerales archaeon]